MTPMVQAPRKSTCYDKDLVKITKVYTRTCLKEQQLTRRFIQPSKKWEGCYWLAHVYGGKVARYTPEGKLDREIKLPTQKPSMCAFGGTRLDTLFITAISTNPDSKSGADKYKGGLFAVNPGVVGIPEPRFSA